MKKINLVVFLILILFIAACKNSQKSMEKMDMGDKKADQGFGPEFEKMCKDRTPDNWMNMKPMVDGKFTSDASCWGCMSDNGMSHFCNKEDYLNYLKNEK